MNKSILTAKTIETVTAACQALADTGTEEAARKVWELLDLLNRQNLLPQLAYNELKQATTEQFFNGKYESHYTKWDYMETVRQQLAYSQSCQRTAAIYEYPLPFGVAHAIRRTITDMMNGGPCEFARWSELEGFLSVFNIVQHHILDQLRPLARDVENRRYKGTFDDLKAAIYKITGTDGYNYN